MDVPPNAPTLTRPLCIGTSGKEVQALQSLLGRSGTGPALTPDGRFGRKTHAALVAFQRQNGLKPDGVIGPGTAKALGWNYRPTDTKPYIIRYDTPPLPAMTPPLAVVAQAIRVGMEPFKAMLFDSIVNAYEGNTNYRNNEEKTRQKFVRYEDLKYYYDKLMQSVTKLEEFSSGQEELAGAEIRNAFISFIANMRSGLQAMDLYVANVRAPIQALERLPYQQISEAVERLLKGEQSAVMVVAQIQIALDNSNRTWALRA